MGHVLPCAKFKLLYIIVRACFFVKKSRLLIVLMFCSNILHLLRPTKAPGFAYAWLELVSHRVFIGRMLAANAPHRVGLCSYSGDCYVTC